jgi:hypothetical protein
LFCFGAKFSRQNFAPDISATDGARAKPGLTLVREPTSFGQQIFMNSSKLFFPWAAQPDIVRSFQKDQFYRKQLSEQSFEVVNKILGRKFI